MAEFKTKSLWLQAGEELIQLAEHDCQITGSPAMGNHARDPLDAAVCFLPPDLPAELRSCAIDIKAIGTCLPTCETQYLLLGYPANRTNVDSAAKKILSERMSLAFPELSIQHYARMGYSRDTHLLLRWRKTWETPTGTGMRLARKLKGSSGGGIWAFDPGSESAPQLVATFTEVPTSKGGKAHVGTRINAHLSLLTDRFKKRGG